METGKERDADGNEYSRNALQTSPRYNVFAAIRTDVERLPGCDLGTIGEAREIIAVAGLTPYVNCVRDGESFTETRPAPVPTIETLGLEPFVQCADEMAVCENDQAMLKVCSSFDWADTFTDPAPDPGHPDDPPLDPPDCADPTPPPVSRIRSFRLSD